MVTVVTCQNDAEYEKCIDFVLRHRRDCYPACRFGTVLAFLNGQLKFGELVVGFNERNEVIAVVGYVYGTPEREFADKSRVRIETICIAEEHRKTRLFYNLLRHVIDHLSRAEVGVKEIEFYVPGNNPYFRKLFSKFSTLASTSKTNFGVEDLFVATMEDLTSYCERLRPQRA
ncbi:GNAT family N-acetyltransferase [Brevibacillus humidisoli]|uniref:GNAT family N-acetyltransferase n=1 Tax=Brevibacillus humidisoli TaxID=2895522 RepID=UPI003B9764EB